MTTDGTAVLVRNPNGGDRKRSVKARTIALRRGYHVRDSTARGETVTLAEEAAREGASVIAACGGDGTLNEVVRGGRRRGRTRPSSPRGDTDRDRQRLRRQRRD